MNLIQTIGRDIGKGANLAGKMGKAFVRNATGGDIKMIAKSKMPKKMPKAKIEARKKTTLKNAAQKMMNRGASQWSK
jgi:hypothetical protein